MQEINKEDENINFYFIFIRSEFKNEIMPIYPL